MKKHMNQRPVIPAKAGILCLAMGAQGPGLRREDGSWEVA